MPWYLTQAGHEARRPTLEHGIYIDGPLTLEEWKKIIGDMIDVACEAAIESAMPSSRFDE